MGIFEELAQEYFERELVVLPIDKGTKKTSLKGWRDDVKDLDPPEIWEKWKNKFKFAGGIGFVCGKTNDLMALDIDTDDQRVVDIVNRVIPKSPVVRRGKKGFAAFYKYNGKRKRSVGSNNKPIVETITEGYQLVIPPSIHPETEKAYEWIEGDLLTADFDLFVEFQDHWFDAIEILIKTECPDFFNSKDNDTTSDGRNNSLSKYTSAKRRSGKSLDETITLCLAYDQKKHAEHVNGPLFQDSSEFPRFNNPYDRAKSFVSSHWKTFDKNEQSNETASVKQREGKKKFYRDFELFFNLHIGDTRKNFIDGRPLRIDENGDWENVRDTHSFENLKSHAVDAGLDVQFMKAHLSRFVRSLDPEFLVDVPEWDGVDRVHEIANHLKIKNVSQECFEYCLKSWAATVFRKVHDHTLQNYTLLFTGKQGLGKDTFVRSLFKCFGLYYKNVHLEDSARENYTLMSAALILNVAEFDEVMKKNPSMLKNILTQDEAFFRKFYGAEGTDNKLRSSVIGSSNHRHLLEDPTGNRRYQIIDLEYIDWNYQKFLGPQLLAQYKHLSENLEVRSDLIAEMDKYIDDETPDDPNESFIEDVIQKVQKEIPAIMGEINFTWGDCEPWISALARANGIGVHHAKQILGRVHFRTNPRRRPARYCLQVNDITGQRHPLSMTDNVKYLKQ